MTQRVDADRHERDKTVAQAALTNLQRPRPAKTTSAAANNGPRRRLPVYE